MTNMPSNNPPEMGKEEQPWWKKELRSSQEGTYKYILEEDVASLLAEASSRSRTETIKEIREEVERKKADTFEPHEHPNAEAWHEIYDEVLALPSLTITEVYPRDPK